MFDTVYVKKTLIDPLVRQEWKQYLESFESDLENQNKHTYYDFQTKDLENMLWGYYIEEDMRLYCQRDSWVDTEQPTVCEKELETVTTYVSFYDFFTTDTHSVFLTFKAHVVEGVVQSIVIDKVEESLLSEERERHNRHRELREMLEEQWEMKAFRAIQTAEWKIERFVRPVKRWFEEVKTYFKQTAENKVKNTHPHLFDNT